VQIIHSATRQFRSLLLLSSLPPILKTLVAFANTAGGALVIALAAEMRKAGQRGAKLNLTEDVETVRNSVTIDWTLRENVRARMRVLVKRILRKYGYPPDKQERATQTVLEQAEVLCAEWAAA
jgi:hypothetical protein